MHQKASLFRRIQNFCAIWNWLQVCHAVFQCWKCVHKLIKYAQRRDVFICEFIDAMKSIEVELRKLQVDPFCKYDNFSFNEFITVYEHCSEQLPLTQVSHDYDVDFYLLPHYVSIAIIIMGSITIEVLMVFMFM